MKTANYQFNSYSSYNSDAVVKAPAESSQSYISQTVAKLKASANNFANLTIDQRIELAGSMQRGLLQVAERSVQAGCKAKGITIGSPAEAEEWATNPWGSVRQLRLIIESLRAIKSKGNTPIGKVTKTVAGNLAVNVFPNNAIDGMLFKEVTVDVYMQPQVTEKSLETDRASFYKKPAHQGKVVLVLGAGNIGAIGVMDVLTKMFNEGKVCLLKMNPVNAYLGPFLEEAFKEAINRHYFAVVYGGVEVGRHLVYHPDIDEVHLTGSDKTHDQIVWGPPGTEQQERKERKEPLLKKTITSELGNVSPVIVVPGPYSEKEIAFQAEAVAAVMTMNASFFCNAAKMMVMPKGWAGSNQFMRAIQRICESVEPRQAYYPGAQDRWQALTQGRTNVIRVGKPQSGALPWTFISGLDAQDENEILFHEEPFCSVLSEVLVGSQNPIEFLEKAVEFCNSKLWGTLNATIIVHPKSLKDPVVKAAFEQAICKLEYGTVAVNTFPGLSFVHASPPWGAYPGSTLENIQSGTGFVHNTAMLESIEKVVIRAPLTVFPKPGWFPSHKTAQITTRRIVEMEEKASWARVPGIIWAAMRG
ncbi:MAG TPA: aldehyde dehydrogenase family protein [Methylotenera sp.]|nr:aldehyde dehydrogenase family protein [Methylotenera sp.]HPH06408.1 aldehyde dehydrogenase family protein [Methylotenera sp.]HPN01816.1 aldehyde dehydrogenase family protein [Methylotenera sp.]